MTVQRRDLWDNPIGTEGFAFVEFTAPDTTALAHTFRQLGFSAVARHRSRPLTLYRQGGVDFILNEESDGPAAAFARTHGPGVSAIAFRVTDAYRAHRSLLAAGATAVEGRGIAGIGGSHLYLFDASRPHEADFEFFAEARPAGAGFTEIDHLTHNVERGRMDWWADFYARLFNFREVRYFDIEGRLTGLRSRAMTSPCGRIRIPINESADDKSQIAEFLHAFGGEGVQHVALATADIVASVAALEKNGLRFLAVPDTYYELLDQRLPGHGLDLKPIAAHHILVDGDPSGLLLQIFTEPLVGPAFFEVIERRGNEGFGEGNFKALFESMELDQIRRGVLKTD